MIIVHATWADGGDGSPALLVWGERPASQSIRRRGRPPKSSTINPHPCAATRDEILDYWSAALDADMRPAAGPWKARSAALWLPSLSGRPIHSSTAGEIEGLELQRWSVECMAMTVSQALALGSLVPMGSDAGFAPDIRFWRDVALFTLSLLSRQRFAPGFRDLGDGSAQAFWRAVIDRPEDREYLRALEQRMPPSCACVASEEADAQPCAPATPHRRFIDTAIDRVIRGCAALRNPNYRRPADLGIAAPWVDALLSGSPLFDLPKWQAAALAKSLASWQEDLVVDSESPFRTCFRLASPEADDDGWRVEYHLQSVEDPSLLVPASDVWKRTGAAALLNGKGAKAQTRLLKDLGRASRMLQEVGESLNQSKPTECELTTDGAHRFLREIAPLLSESGFGVLVPEWWNAKRGRVAARLKVSSPGGGEAAAESAFGMDAILDFDWMLSVDGETISPEDFARLVALKQPLVQIRGQWVEFDSQGMQAALKRFEERLAGGGIRTSDLLRIALGGEDILGIGIEGVEATGWVSDVIDRLLSREEMPELAAPLGLQGKLRPYQIRGFSWISWMREMGFGVCLADDMGLGKTIQLIALLLRLKAEGVQGPSLLICPTSVVGNWRREIQRFAPSLSVLTHHGAERASCEEFAERAAEHDVVVTSYALSYRDLAALTRVRWNVLALDEAQNVKNPGTKQSQAVRRMSAVSRIALTGTPVENRLSDLWSIMDFVNPGYLGSRESFRKHYALPVERQNDEDAASRLRAMVTPFILRRLKTDSTIISDLPEKWENRVYCPLTMEQATLYEAVVKDSLTQIEKSEGIDRKGAILSTLMKLKQICNHPSQFLKDGSRLEGRSGKLSRLAEMLKESVSAGDSALVFTQFAEMGEMLRGYVEAALGAPTLYLHGGVPARGRDEMVRRFQEADGPHVFILSLKAGGVGLNLTRANHVFHYDRWWNPAVENQATDRAFRIGQMRNVQVHKFVCEGTIEERIDEQLERKQELADSVIGAGENWITELSTDELREMLVLRHEDVVEEVDA